MVCWPECKDWPRPPSSEEGIPGAKAEVIDGVIVDVICGVNDGIGGIDGSDGLAFCCNIIAYIDCCD